VSYGVMKGLEYLYHVVVGLVSPVELMKGGWYVLLCRFMGLMCLTVLMEGAGVLYSVLEGLFCLKC